MVENGGPDHGQLMIQPAHNFVLAEQKRMLAKGDPELVAPRTDLDKMPARVVAAAQTR